MLGNTIALIAVAALFGIEAWKARGGIPRLTLTALAVMFALSGVFLKPFTDAVPKAGQIVADIFSQPAAWFVLAIGLFFVVRPLWQAKPKPVATAPSYAELCNRSKVILARLRQQRTMPDFRRRVLGIEPLGDVVRDGLSALMIFENSGFQVPRLNADSAERHGVALEAYFGVMIPLLRDGHADYARNQSEAFSKEAVRLASAFKIEEWRTDDAW